MPSLTRRYRLSLLVNALLLAAFVGVVVHERYIQRIQHYYYPPAPQPVIPEQSLLYKEQLDFFSIYPRQRNIVMLGNSFTHKMMWNELLERDDVANRGIGGDLTAGMLHRMRFVVALHPKICFIEGGMNDVDARIPPDTIVRNLARITDVLKADQIVPVLMTVTYVTDAYPAHDSVNAAITQLNEKISRLAAQQNTDLIDLNPRLAIHAQLLPQYARDDGNHFTSKAYLVWKEEILRILKAHGI